MASEIVATERKTIDQRLAEIPGDMEIEFLTDPLEVKLIQQYREADEEGKAYITKTMRAAAAGLLPPLDVINAMTAAERRAFVEALPLEVEA